MFNKTSNRYMTRSIAKEIHPEIAMRLWNLIDERKMEEDELDYLQVFELFIEDGKQLVLHRQEQPSYSKQWLIELKHTVPIPSTIWCIDDGQSQMMLFPTDY
ncbi:DUF960 family protein [Cytobacillus firmus]|uniref:DUF960 domain-containing protein n=1 Tax=Cytobacillus firmus DS1 TaxID=1307436 RepID=W7KX97_CYTFI|nr:DUF960 family protein [Cytobacillus firmus]EWG12035.1 hypothetical protein PBF_04548 [Cytobacillus firmus DS1]